MSMGVIKVKILNFLHSLLGPYMNILHTTKGYTGPKYSVLSVLLFHVDFMFSSPDFI